MSDHAEKSNPNHEAQMVDGNGGHVGHRSSASALLSTTNDGSNLAKQISVNLTPEQYERLFFQPGPPKRGDAAKRYGNPTPLAIFAFLLSLTPTSCILMGWRGATPAALVPLIGVFYLVSGLSMTLAGIGEWVLGNTFPCVVFITFGGFWLSLGTLQDPMHQVAVASGGAASRDLNTGFAFYLIFWAVTCFWFLLASLRTNIVFAWIFFTLVVAFALLSCGYFYTASGDASLAGTMFKAGGGFAFATCMGGWYLALVLILAATDIPITLPVGDLSSFMSRRAK